MNFTQIKLILATVCFVELQWWLKEREQTMCSQCLVLLLGAHPYIITHLQHHHHQHPHHHHHHHHDLLPHPAGLMATFIRI